MNMNRQGQSCSSTSRVFVHASLHKQVIAELHDCPCRFMFMPLIAATAAFLGYAYA